MTDPMTGESLPVNQKSSRTRPAWAVKAKLWPDKPMAMLGVGWFGWPEESHLQGCTTALFFTRREARIHAERVRTRNGIAASAIPVRITITEMSND